MITWRARPAAWTAGARRSPPLARIPRQRSCRGDREDGQADRRARSAAAANYRCVRGRRRRRAVATTSDADAQAHRVAATRTRFSRRAARAAGVSSGSPRPSPRKARGHTRAPCRRRRRPDVTTTAKWFAVSPASDLTAFTVLVLGYAKTEGVGVVETVQLLWGTPVAFWVIVGPAIMTAGGVWRRITGPERGINGDDGSGNRSSRRTSSSSGWAAPSPCASCARRCRRRSVGRCRFPTALGGMGRSVVVVGVGGSRLTAGSHRAPTLELVLEQLLHPAGVVALRLVRQPLLICSHCSIAPNRCNRLRRDPRDEVGVAAPWRGARPSASRPPRPRGGAAPRSRGRRAAAIACCSIRRTSFAWRSRYSLYLTPTSTASFPSAGSGGLVGRRAAAPAARLLGHRHLDASAIAASGTRRISSAERSWPLASDASRAPPTRRSAAGRRAGSRTSAPDRRPRLPQLRRAKDIVADEAGLIPALGQPLVGIVGAEEQPVLGARGEHAVRLHGTAAHEVVDERRQCTPRRDGSTSGRPAECGEGELPRGPERRRLLVARRADDLPREVEPGALAHLERVRERARVDVIVLDVVSGLDDLCAFDIRYERTISVCTSRGKAETCRSPTSDELRPSGSSDQWQGRGRARARLDLGAAGATGAARAAAAPQRPTRTPAARGRTGTIFVHVRLLVKVLWHVISESFIATSPPSFRNEKGMRLLGRLRLERAVVDRRRLEMLRRRPRLQPAERQLERSSVLASAVVGGSTSSERLSPSRTKLPAARCVRPTWTMPRFEGARREDSRPARGASPPASCTPHRRGVRAACRTTYYFNDQSLDNSGRNSDGRGRRRRAPPPFSASRYRSTVRAARAVPCTAGPFRRLSIRYSGCRRGRSATPISLPARRPRGRGGLPIRYRRVARHLADRVDALRHEDRPRARAQIQKSRRRLLRPACPPPTTITTASDADATFWRLARVPPVASAVRQRDTRGACGQVGGGGPRRRC